ncbi:MAG: hypothetical protein O2924_04160 [Chloroflexi bacterium]|nr:hypothetical protein [Chloroflexota bacterium]MQC47512.1 hypothetical protein [Chloroflexota bacterium]
MNVVLNTDEAHVVLSLVTSAVIDHADLSDEAREKIRDWRKRRGPGMSDLDAFTESLNIAIGNFIDERTRRMMRQRGKLKVRE